MVRVALIVSASTASAFEPTGLLQATVGVQNHLSMGSDKVSSLKKMEKEWQVAAKSGSQVSDEVLQTVYDSMMDILSDADDMKADIENSTVIAAQAVTDTNTAMGIEHDNLVASAEPGYWGGVCQSLEDHATCRGGENDDCTDRDDECKDKDDLLDHCAGDNPLCHCANAGNSAEEMKLCLERAKAWYDNYHVTNHSLIPEEKPRGYFLGSLGAGDTRCDFDKEATECTDGIATCDNKKTACDEEQRSCQEEYCNYKSRCDTWCASYQTSYSNAITTFNEEIALQLTNDDSAMNRNKEVCYAAKKVVCYINVIANMGYETEKTYYLDTEYAADYKQNDTDDDGSGYTYDFCLTYTPECDHLDIPTPSAPEEEDCSTYNCYQTTSASGLPEDQTWFDAYYAQSPAPVDCSHNISFYLESQPENFHSCR